jgi:hypothetical protein
MVNALKWFILLAKELGIVNAVYAFLMLGSLIMIVLAVLPFENQYNWDNVTLADLPGILLTMVIASALLVWYRRRASLQGGDRMKNEAERPEVDQMWADASEHYAKALNAFEAARQMIAKPRLEKALKLGTERAFQEANAEIARKLQIAISELELFRNNLRKLLDLVQDTKETEGIVSLLEITEKWLYSFRCHYEAVMVGSRSPSLSAAESRFVELKFREGDEYFRGGAELNEQLIEYLDKIESARLRKI